MGTHYSGARTTISEPGYKAEQDEQDEQDEKTIYEKDEDAKRRFIIDHIKMPLIRALRSMKVSLQMDEKGATRSGHEAYAIIKEELDEYWESVKSNNANREELVDVIEAALTAYLTHAVQQGAAGRAEPLTVEGIPDTVEKADIDTITLDMKQSNWTR